MIQILLKSHKIEVYFIIFRAVLPSLDSSGMGNSTLQKFHGCKTLDQIVRTLLTQAFHLSQELYDIDFQMNTKDFQSHGNRYAEDLSHP